MGRDPRLARPATALTVGVLIVVMMAALAVISSFTHSDHASAFILVGVYIAFAAVGVILVRKLIHKQVPGCSTPSCSASW